MKSDQLPLISQAASIIRDVIGCEFEWDTPGHRECGTDALMILLHPTGSELRPYCNYDCAAIKDGGYAKIDELADALSAIGLMVEDCTGDYSGVYEVSHA